MAASQRPMGLTILAWLAIIGGISNLLNAIYLLSPPTLLLGGIGQLFLGVLNLIFGFGALALKPWAWGYGVGVQALSIIGNMYNLVAFPAEYAPASIIGIVINGLILYYLFRPNVKRVFGKA